MAKKEDRKNSILLYTDNYVAARNLITAEQKGTLFDAIHMYVLGEELPEMDATLTAIWQFYKIALDRAEQKYNEKCERNRANGMKGGAPAGNSNASKNNQTAGKTTETTQNNRTVVFQPKQPKTSETTLYDSDSDNDSVSDSYKEKETNKEKEITQSQPPSYARLAYNVNREIQYSKDTMSSEKYLQDIAMLTHSSIPDLNGYMQYFMAHIRATEKSHVSIGAFKEHFINFINKRKDYNDGTRTNTNNQSAGERLRKNVDISNFETEDYNVSGLQDSMHRMRSS